MIKTSAMLMDELKGYVNLTSEIHQFDPTISSITELTGRI